MTLRMLPALMLLSMLLACSVRAEAAPVTPPVITADVDGLVRVTTSLERARVRVGRTISVTVEVEALPGEPAPVAVRGRLGMPDHGHWVTDETRLVVGGEPLRFAGEIPMTGKYRFRIWVELPNGETTTAVDFLAPADRAELVVFSTKPDPPAPPPQELGSAAPDFDLPGLAGAASVSLASLEGKPVWIAFWASWCGPCRAELPEFAEFQGRWSDKGAAVVSISLDSDAEMAEAFLARLGLDIPSVIDADGGTAHDYHAQRIPLNVLIDADGNVVQRLEGYRPDLYEDGDRWIAALLQ